MRYFYDYILIDLPTYALRLLNFFEKLFSYLAT